MLYQRGAFTRPFPDGDMVQARVTSKHDCVVLVSLLLNVGRRQKRPGTDAVDRITV